jgi:phosphoribosylaminoimidazolecarboxamide formyltransferase/IMP cyclohydrolase
VLNGEPSYITLLDAANSWQLVREAAAARETWALGEKVGRLTSAYVRARDVDPKSSFGDLIAVSEPVDAELAEFLSRVVADGILAPGYEFGTVEVLARKKGGAFLVLEADPGFEPPQWESRDIFGILVEQQRDQAPITAELLGSAELDPLTVVDALLGLITLRYTQSNSVAVVKDGMTFGVGAGQQNRVDCVRLATNKAATWWLRRHDQVRGLPAVAEMSRQDRLNWQIRIADDDMTHTQRAEFASLFPGAEPALASAERSAWSAGLDGLTHVSDGFLPFRDNVDFAARANVRCIVEPGGSSRSGDVAAACDELGITLVRTGLRLFHH